MHIYWLTVAVPARDQADAESAAEIMAAAHGGRVVDVQREPPQGACIVGDMHEDAL